MIRRRFGRTNLQMPVITCGGMRYQQSWKDEDAGKITAENQENLERTIHHAVENGINHIETARGYGTSELQLGRVLSSFQRDKIIVQTKVAPAETEKEFLQKFELSMSNLQLDHVDLLGIHGINTPELLDMTLRKGGALETARKLQKEGRVRFIGFSTHAEVDTIVSAVDSDEFDYVNLHWYYVNQVNWPAIVAATRRDMGVFIISPNDKGGKLYAPSDKLSQLCAPFSPMAFNNLFCLSHPQVHTLSMGVSRPS
ncbi:MAG: aldo/keto reductase, partial [Chthoniobacterales bacterium]